MGFMEKGKVIFFNKDKGFGFITRESEKYLFFHITGSQCENLEKDDSVEFELVQSEGTTRD
jgi:cold shock CspA family protein